MNWVHLALCQGLEQGLRRRHWTQARLSEESGVTQKHLSALLNGHCGGSVATWAKLYDALGVSSVLLVRPTRD